MEHITILATSLNPESRSQVLARLFESALLESGAACERLDLRDLELPMAGSPGSWERPATQVLQAAVERASHVVFAVPTYNYGVNAAAKNVVELVGRGFTRKIVGFLCAAGGSGSYMAVMAFANQLMLDFRCIIVPRFRYVPGDSWDAAGALDAERMERLRRMVGELREIRLDGPAGS